MWSPAPLNPNSPHYPASSNPAGPLFAPDLISPEVASALPEGYSIRPLERSDYKAGFLEPLKVLTAVGDIDEKAWNEQYDWMSKRGDEYYILVICNEKSKIVGTGGVIVERKFIHNLGKVGHIEDIAVLRDQQGKKLGLRIIQALDFIAKKVGCYKVRPLFQNVGPSYQC
ncbi:MAG: hypothetical protein Q9190_007438 [Brigantiaea leucoxantha]